MTQIEYAQKGIITPQIKYVAEIEQRPIEFIADRVASGTVVIPANIGGKIKTVLRRLLLIINRLLFNAFGYHNFDD